VENNEINIYNTYQYLNDFYSSNFLEEKMSYKIKLDRFLKFPIENKFIYKTHGYLINNITSNCEYESMSLKVETNLRFKIILNNNIIFSNDDHFDSLINLDNLNKNSPDPKIQKIDFNEISTFNSKKFCLTKNSINQLTILYQFYYEKNKENKSENNLHNGKIQNNLFSEEISNFFHSKNSINSKQAYFFLSYVKDKKIINFETTDFIPFVPYENFLLKKSVIYENIEILNCKVEEKNFNFSEKIKTKIFSCPDICSQSDKYSICRKVFENGIIPNTGGNFILTHQNQVIKYYSVEFPKIGLDHMITDIKLGYEDDYKKFSRQANAILFKNHIIKIDVNTFLNEDDSFLFYKKDLIFDKNNFDDINNYNSENINDKKFAEDSYIVINVKIVCENSEELTNLEYFKTKGSN